MILSDLSGKEKTDLFRKVADSLNVIIPPEFGTVIILSDSEKDILYVTSLQKERLIEILAKALDTEKSGPHDYEYTPGEE